MRDALMSIDYVNPWIYKDSIFDTDMIDDNFGFVYLITDLETGKKYIGRKYFWAMRTPKGKTRRQKSESDWKKYYSSHEEIKTIGKKNPLRYKREILRLCKGKGETNFMEIHEQFHRNVLFSDEYVNEHINSKWFKKNVIKYTL
jgi:hypothetical protein